MKYLISKTNLNGDWFQTIEKLPYFSCSDYDLKDAITATEPRFYEFIKPRPPPPDFLQVARQVSNAGEPLAKNTACALGEIKTVG